MSFNCTQKIIIILAIPLITLVQACSFIDYKEAKLDVNTINKELNTVTTDDQSFNEILIKNGYEKNNLPLDKWGLEELILAQLVYNQEIQMARTEWEIIKTEEGIANLNPTNSLGVIIGRGDSNQEISKNIYGVGISFIFESADKKLIRHEIAYNKSLSAFFSYQISTNEIQNHLLEGLISYIENQDLILIQKKEVQLNQSIVNMVMKRFDMGIASQIDLDRLTLALSNSYQDLIILQTKQDELKQKIATLVGMTVEKFSMIPIDVDGIKSSLKKTSETFTDSKFINEVKKTSVLNSLSLRKLLANYAVSESELKLEIAKQYPDFHFNPAYIYDVGNNIWSLGIDSALSSPEKNKIFINKAKKNRALEAKKIYAYQLDILNQAENLQPIFQNKKNELDQTKSLVEAKNRLSQQLNELFDRGILDRLDLEIELAKLNEVDKKYHKALYNLINSGLDAQKKLQNPIINKKSYLFDEK